MYHFRLHEFFSKFHPLILITLSLLLIIKTHGNKNKIYFLLSSVALLGTILIYSYALNENVKPFLLLLVISIAGIKAARTTKNKTMLTVSIIYLIISAILTLLGMYADAM